MKFITTILGLVLAASSLIAQQYQSQDAPFVCY